MSRTVICIQEHVVGDGDVQVSFRIEEPDDVTDAERSYVLDIDRDKPVLAYVVDPAAQAQGGEPVKLAGAEIFARLTVHPGIGEALERASHAAAGEIHPIYIETSANDAELLPWEVLFHGQKGFFALDPRWPIVRVTGRRAGRTSVDRLVKGRLTIAAVLAAQDRDARPEWDALQTALEGSAIDHDLLVLVAQDDLRDHIAQLALASVTVEHVPTGIDALLARLAAHEPNLLHFFCHGSADYGGYLEVATRNTALLGEPPLYLKAQQLAQAAGQALLVTLNACEGALPIQDTQSLAYALVKEGAPAAIGMRHAIESQTAHRFCGAFYEAALAHLEAHLQGPPEAALDWGPLMRVPRNRLCAHHGGPIEVAAAGCREWTLPVLYVRPEPLKVQVASPTAPEDPEYVFAMLETLRAQRARMHPDTPAATLQQLDLMIAQLQAQFKAAED